MTASAGYQAPPIARPSIQTHAPPFRSSSPNWGSPRALEGASRRLTDTAQARPVFASAWASATATEPQAQRLTAAGRPSYAVTYLPVSRTASGALSGSLTGDAFNAAGPRLSAPGQRTPVTRSMSANPRAAALRSDRCNQGPYFRSTPTECHEPSSHVMPVPVGHCCALV